MPARLTLNSLGKQEVMFMEKSQRTKSRIFQTAFRLFEENGYRNTTIPRICEEAGVSRSTFFHYFKSKNAILADYRFGFADRLEEFADTLPSDLTGKEKVRRLLQFDVRQNLEGGAMLRPSSISSLDDNPEFRGSHDRTFERVPPLYARVLRESNPQVSEEYCEKVALLITRLYWMIWQSCILMRDPYDFEQELMDSLDMVWDGFGLK